MIKKSDEMWSEMTKANQEINSLKGKIKFKKVDLFGIEGNHNKD